MKSLQLPLGEHCNKAALAFQHQHISSSLTTFPASSSSPSSPSSSSSFSSSSSLFSCGAAPASPARVRAADVAGENALGGSPLVPMLLVRAAPAVAPLPPMGALHCRSLLRAVSGSGLRVLRLPVLGQTVLFPVPAQSTNRGTFTRRFHVRQPRAAYISSSLPTRRSLGAGSVLCRYICRFASAFTLRPHTPRLTTLEGEQGRGWQSRTAVH